VGSIYALNTLGTVTGSFVTGFFLLPRLGSVKIREGCAAANIVLGLGFALGLLSLTPARKWTFSAVAGLTAILFLVGYGGWDMRRVTGTYAYFNEGWAGEVVFLKEDVQGGLTSVVRKGNLAHPALQRQVSARQW